MFRSPRNTIAARRALLSGFGCIWEPMVGGYGFARSGSDCGYLAADGLGSEERKESTAAVAGSFAVPRRLLSFTWSVSFAANNETGT